MVYLIELNVYTAEESDKNVSYNGTIQFQHHNNYI